MQKPQNEHFVRDSWTSKYLLPQTHSKSMFCAMLPSIFNTSNASLPRNLHVVTTWCSTDNAIRKKHATPHVLSAALATQHDLPRKMQLIFQKQRNSLRMSHGTIFDTKWNMLWNVTKCHTCHTKRRCATEPSKSDHFCSTPQRHGHSKLTRTTANTPSTLKAL